MKFCKKCGSQIADGQVCGCAGGASPQPQFHQSPPQVPPRAVSPIPTHTPQARPAPQSRPQAQSAGHGAQSVDGISLSDKEVVVRTYTCSESAFPKCVCNLTVTNRRVIYHGRINNGRIIDAVPLDSVTAISSFYVNNISYGMLIVGALFALLGIAALVQGWGLIIGLVALVVGGGLAYFAFQKRTFLLKVFSSSASNCPIEATSSGSASAANKMATISFAAKPTNETESMLCELGAMITDLQTMGDYGVNLWQR